MSDIVKYHNQMNAVNFSGYTEKELNMFFSLVFLANEKGTTKLTIPFSELKELADGDKNKERFIKNLVNVNKKLIRLNHQIEINNIIHIFSLFNTFSIDKDKNELIVQVNEIFSYMLNDLIGNFTKFDLLEFVSLKSSYSKNTFKLLKQWESVNKKTFEIEEFKKLLGVPKSYTSTNFNERVLKPIKEELPYIFHNFVLEKIKTGRKVTHLKFTWSNKKQKIKEVEKIEISEKLNKAIQKVKKNRFIEKLFNSENIEILINTFNEADLIRGLNWSYKEIKQEINSLNYLIKTIKTGIEKIEKKIIVKEDLEKIPDFIAEKNLEAALENSKIEIPEKIKVTQAEYENLYQTYLKENNETHNIYIRKGFDIANRNKYEIVYPLKDERIEIINDTYIYYLFEEMDRLEIITGITEKELLKKMAETILNKKYVVVPFEFKNPNHMSELDDSIKRDYTLEARLRYTEKDHLNYLKNTNKTINFSDLDKNLLLSKTGKILTGGALEARLEKIAKDLKKVIFYKNKVIGDIFETY